MISWIGCLCEVLVCSVIELFVISVLILCLCIWFVVLNVFEVIVRKLLEKLSVVCVVMFLICCVFWSIVILNWCCVIILRIDGNVIVNSNIVKFVLISLRFFWCLWGVFGLILIIWLKFNILSILFVLLCCWFECFLYKIFFWLYFLRWGY